MAAFKYPLRIEKGASFDEEVTYKAGDPAVAVDLTGCTARAQIRESVDAATVLVDMTTENGKIVLGGVAGTIAFNLSPSETAALAFDQAVYDLELIFPSGKVKRLMEGAVYVKPEVTR